MNLCKLCNYKTSFQHELEKHVMEYHPSCNTCQRMFSNYTNRRCHLLHSPSHNYCWTCDLDFRSLAALEGHKETHQPKCPQCDRHFQSASGVAKHMELGNCFRLTQKQWVKKIRDWELVSGKPNYLTVPRLGNLDDNGSREPNQPTAGAYNGRACECDFCKK